jgi:hypothetical protein
MFEAAGNVKQEGTKGEDFPNNNFGRKCIQDPQVKPAIQKNTAAKSLTPENASLP